MIDIEADGPIPGDYSMVSFGAVVPHRTDHDGTGQAGRDISPAFAQPVQQSITVREISGFAGVTVEPSPGPPLGSSGLPPILSVRRLEVPQWIPVKQQWQDEADVVSRFHTDSESGPELTDSGFLLFPGFALCPGL